jgi:hypothetical protein
MTTLILKGNRSRAISLKGDGSPALSGVSQLNTWIQTNDPVDAEFIDSTTETESRWEIRSAASSDEWLQARLEVTESRLAELRKSRQFGCLRCVRVNTEPVAYHFDATIVVSDSELLRIRHHLRSVLKDGHIFYAHSVYLDNYPADAHERSQPSFQQFLNGELCYFSSAQFSLIREDHPDSVSLFEIRSVPRRFDGQT